MKRILSLLFLMCMVAVTSRASNIIEQGDSAYSANDFRKAIECYNAAIEQYGTSPQLYYNLGNAYYRSDSIARAILSYNRALKLDPSYKDARFNLQFVNDKYNLKAADRSATSIFADDLTYALHPDTWALISLLLFILMLSGIAAYIYLNSTLYRKIGFFAALLLVPITVISIVISFKAHSAVTSDKSCIVVVPSAQLSTTPSIPVSPSQQAFTVPEGYRFVIKDYIATPLDNSTDGWYEVKVDEDNSAWISSNDIELI